LRNFTGIDDPYEAPVRPEVVLDTTKMTIEEAGNRVMALLRSRIRKV
jgi:adenylylsulfate kinase-like enzyme